MRALAGPIAVLLAAAPSGAKPPEVLAIDASCDAVARLDDAHKKNARLFGDASDAVRPQPGDGSGRWMAFKDPDALKAFAAKEGAPNTQAFVWSAADGTTIAFMTFTSDSGDWSDDVGYCFRVDGSLARADATLVSVTEDVSGRRVTYFGPDRRVLYEHEEAAEGGKRPLHGPDKMAALDKTIVYPTVSSLPFLARPPAKAGGADNIVAGDLTPEDVALTVRHKLPAVQGCYERALAKTPKLAGKIVVRWTIERDGSTKGVAVESDTLADPLVGACVVDQVRKWRFSPPPATGHVDVSFPFIFQTNDRSPPDAGAIVPKRPPMR